MNAVMLGMSFRSVIDFFPLVYCIKAILYMCSKYQIRLGTSSSPWLTASVPQVL